MIQHDFHDDCIHCAWKLVEASLPEGHLLEEVVLVPGAFRYWTATVWRDRGNTPAWVGEGESPAAALLALAEKMP